jgi:hypothetical protein
MTSIGQAAAERSRAPAFPEQNSFFRPACCHAAVVRLISGVPKDRSNVIDQKASQRACQLTGTSSDRDSRDFGPQNVGQSKDDANSKQRP